MKQRRQMKLTSRIVLAFLAVSIIPIVLITVVVVRPMSTRLHSYGLQYGIDDLSYSNMYNTSAVISSLTEEQFQELKSEIAAGGGRLTDRDYLDGINADLADVESALIVRRGNEIFYDGSGGELPLQEYLPAYGSIAQEENDWKIISSDMKYLIKQADCVFPDGSYGSVFIVSDMNQIWPGMRNWLAELAFVCILILVMTALVMGLWIYLSVTNPLNRLKKAVKNIRDGKLDFQLTGTSVQEINELCEDFEEMRRRLLESQEEKLAFDKENRELISNISHDLKTPITAVRGYCEGIMDGVADTPEKMDRYIRTIYNKANEMDSLINELTFYSKIDTNRIPYTFTKIHISDYFNDCADELELELEQKNVRLVYENRIEGDPLVIGDGEQLSRVIHNVVNNSVKYMDKPERLITIRLTENEDSVRFEIGDNGRGIGKKDLARIFDRFYRTDASRNSAKGGSGIGLSIVKKIMEDHGGSVWASSEEGKGTVMHFVLRKYQDNIADV